MIHSYEYCECGTLREYSDRYDSYFCRYCNKWLENGCDDPACHYCVSRPEKPLGDES